MKEGRTRLNSGMAMACRACSQVKTFDRDRLHEDFKGYEGCLDLPNQLQKCLAIMERANAGRVSILNTGLLSTRLQSRRSCSKPV